MQAEAGQSLATIIQRKEAERSAGNGLFWWGIGQSLGLAVCNAAKLAGDTLPVLWSEMLSKPQAIDAFPSGIRRWMAYEDSAGRINGLPAHVTVTSRVSKRNHHYALVCWSDTPISLGDLGAFNPAACRTVKSSKVPADSQVTALLYGDPFQGHDAGSYRIAFRAILVEPWAVKLVHPE